MKLEINEKGCARINLYLNTIRNEDEKLIYEKLKDEKYPSNNIKEILYKYFKEAEQSGPLF